MTDGSWDLAAEDALERLQADCGSDWMVWYVPCWDGHQRWLTWCARRHADGALLHATQPDHLAEYIAAADEAVAAAAGELIWHRQERGVTLPADPGPPDVTPGRPAGDGARPGDGAGSQPDPPVGAGEEEASEPAGRQP